DRECPTSDGRTENFPTPGHRADVCPRFQAERILKSRFAASLHSRGITVPSTSGKPKVVILGGGAAALTCAFELTEPPDWRQRFESVAVYQMGWRLGGKGASGRNARFSQRIEEHGLHVWPGFYENAFHLMRRCYDELGRPAGAPLAKWDDA